jgi:DNA-binding NarL/FixJ family response regulator
VNPLTRREVEVARLIVRGWSYCRVARSLGITERTVQSHVVNAAAKIGGDGPPKIRLVLFVTNRLDAAS